MSNMLTTEAENYIIKYVNEAKEKESNDDTFHDDYTFYGLCQSLSRLTKAYTKQDYLAKKAYDDLIKIQRYSNANRFHSDRKRFLIRI